MDKIIQSSDRINSNFLAINTKKKFFIEPTEALWNNAKNIIFVIIDSKSNRLSLVKTWGLTSPRQSKLEYDPDAVNFLSTKDNSPVIFGQPESFPEDWDQYEVFCSIMNAEEFLGRNIFTPKVMKLIGLGQNCQAIHPEGPLCVLPLGSNPN